MVFSDDFDQAFERGFISFSASYASANRVTGCTTRTSSLSPGRRRSTASGSRAAGGDNLGMGFRQMIDLAVHDLAGGLIVGDELGAGGAAAPVRLCHLDIDQPLNPAEQFPGLGPDVLGAAQVAGVVIGDDAFQSAARFFQRDRTQKLGHIPHLRAEGCSAVRPFGVIP